MRAALAALILIGCGPGKRPEGTDDGGGSDGDGSNPVNQCKVQDENAVGMCDDVAPPNSFEPELQWSWTGPNGEAFSIVTPLVANPQDVLEAEKQTAPLRIVRFCGNELAPPGQRSPTSRVSGGLRRRSVVYSS